METKVREIGFIDDVLEPVNSGEIAGKDPQTGQFLPGNNFGRGNRKGWKSPKRRIAEMWEEIPVGQKMARGEALLLTIWNMAISQQNEAMIKMIMGYLEGLPKQPIDFSGEVEHVHTADEKFQEGLHKILQVFENLKKPRKTFKYEEAVVKPEHNKLEKSIPKETKKDEPKLPGVGTIYIPPDPE